LFILAPITWSSGHNLTLTALHSLYITAPVTHTGASPATLTLNPNNGTDPFPLLAGAPTTGRLFVYDSQYGGNLNGSVNLVAATDHLMIDGNPYTLIGSNADFGAMNMAAGHFYALVADLPAGTGNFANQNFGGYFDGLGHTISGLTISTAGTTTEGLGLFGGVLAGA